MPLARTRSNKFLPRSRYVKEDDITASMPFLLRPFYVLTGPDSATSSLRFLTCSKFDHILHVHEDITTYAPTTSYKILLRPSILFFKDVVRTWRINSATVQPFRCIYTKQRNRSAFSMYACIFVYAMFCVFDVFLY